MQSDLLGSLRCFFVNLVAVTTTVASKGESDGQDVRLFWKSCVGL
jgi:hypothetical protein